MLSKSAARAFFLGGTAVCTLAFIGLTVDTFNRIPSQTNADAISEAVVRGKDLWDRNNCMGCHTLMGEGAYYAPELTRVYERRGPEFIRSMLRDPEAMFPGERKMQKYDFSEGEIEDLVAFFAWMNTVDLNGFPAKPVLAAAAPSKSAHAGAPLVFRQVCTACHTLDGQGGKVGPALDGVGGKFDAAYIGRWLRNPEEVKPGTKMPKLPLTDGQVEELVGFLSAQKSEVTP